jgi:hypothetical protein
MRRWLENVRDTDRRCFFEFEDNGQVKLSALAALDSEQAALIEGIEQTKYGVRLIMLSKLQAAAQLARLDGLDAPTKVAPTTPDGGPLTLADAVAASFAHHQAKTPEPAEGSR